MQTPAPTITPAPSVAARPERLPLYALFAANAVSAVGDVLAFLAVPWFVLETTGSLTQTGITAACTTASVAVSAFFGASVVDWLGYRTASVISDLASGLSIALIPLLYLVGHLAFPALLALVFLGALAIAVRAVVPVEEARRRQLAFTADASHELRTPLSVLEAEVSLARSSPRDAAHYEEVLTRVAHETGRLTRIVEDLLWLARFDAQPPPPRSEPIDLGTIAEGCRARFAAVARRRGVDLSVVQGAGPVRIAAPPEWIDRLAGVLVDNACRYAPEGGTVRVVVGTEGGQALLAVEDDGPGIPPDAREHLFDRFARASDAPGGHGLGLAIADSVVRGTSGRWHVGTAPAGGARMAVTWPGA